MGFFKSLFNKITNRAEIEWDEIEADLIAADLGVRGAMEIVDELKDLGRKVTAEDVIDVARAHISRRLPDRQTMPQKRGDGMPCVILVVGVNGVGKTTSSAKLAHWMQRQGHSVILAAADTFVPPRWSSSNAGAKKSACPSSRATRMPTLPPFVSPPIKKPSRRKPISSFATQRVDCTHATT